MPRSLPGAVICLPSTRTSPVLGSSNPAMMRNMVVLPQPDAPIRQTNWPRSMFASMRPSASTSPSPIANRLVAPRIAMWDWPRSCMVLWAPFQDAIADDDDEAIGTEPDHSVKDHSVKTQAVGEGRAAVT